MGVGGTNSDLTDEEWDDYSKREEERLENQVTYDPAFTALLGRISNQIVPISETVVRILFDKPKPKE